MIVLILIPILVFVLDHKVKSYVETHKKEGQSERIFGGHITIRRMSNKGVAGSMLDEKPKVVTWISGLILGVMSICYMRDLFRKGNNKQKISYGLILGGGWSNFFDRIKKGAVTDYFSFNVPFKWLRRLVFNISDMFITLGSVLAVVFRSKDSE